MESELDYIQTDPFQLLFRKRIQFVWRWRWLMGRRFHFRRRSRREMVKTRTKGQCTKYKWPRRIENG